MRMPETFALRTTNRKCEEMDKQKPSGRELGQRYCIHSK